MPSGCDHTSSPSGKSYLESTLSAGTYTVVLKGDTTSGAGAYKLSLRDSNTVSIADTSVACNNDASRSTATSSLTQTLTAGTYYALVKGYSTTDSGYYQLNIGGGSTSVSTYTPPTWAQTQAALQNTSTKIISVLSCHDDPDHGNNRFGTGDCDLTRAQAVAMSNATNSLGKNGQNLVYDIDGDGTITVLQKDVGGKI